MANDLSTKAYTSIPVVISYARIDGTIPSLVGASMWFTVKNSKVDADPGVLQKLYPSSADITVDTVAKTITAMIQPGELPITNGQLSQSFYWDLKIKEANGLESDIEGTLTISMPVTRSY